ncbi:unnamed protein product [Mytilus edulis]|uniref:OLD protein-like TOPRIM domain-containing protein n=1 Tax=Mytilus edulis TaxID=6550 RepID=A0A8S3UG29_MYTED|nr:unnamed protein product [Mytilus edulis]
MVERMRDIFQKEKIHNHKVVIVVTHNPFLINSITAEHTHVFFRKSRQMLSKCPFGIRAINDINRHITDIDNLKKLIFAAKVLCMEGTTDKIVIEGLFDHIFKFTDKDENVKHSIVSHQLVVLGTKTFDNPVRKFCTQINLPSKWIFDRDKYVELKGDKIANIDADGDYSQFKDQPVIEFLQNVNGFKKLSEELSDKDIFIWKWGDLEDTIIHSLNPDDLTSIFKKKMTTTLIKKKLSTIKRDKLANLARCMYEDSNRPNEVDRFLEFLQRGPTRTC